MNNLLKTLTVLAIVLLSTACSNQTQKATTQDGPSQQRSQQEGQQRGGQRGGPPQFSELLAKMDSNKDGRLSASEVQGPLKNDFSKIDRDGDGYLTESEMRNAPKPERRGRN